MIDSKSAELSLPSKEKAEILLRAALEKKASQPILIRLEGLTSLTDYFLIVSARSAKQVTAIAEGVVQEAKKRKIKRLSTEGVHQGNWALLDFGDVIVHVFAKGTREFYDLEGLWAEAPREAFPEDIRLEIEATAAQADEEEDEEF